MYLMTSTLAVVLNIGEQFQLALLYKFFLLKERFIVTSHSHISRYKGKTMTQTLIFGNAQIILSATKEHKTPAI